uniref:Uncharacterized protein n=1 Tax=Sipha flava TaxID=143950 RepID=A0A2S2R0X9_9HEMI
MPLPEGVRWTRVRCAPTISSTCPRRCTRRPSRTGSRTRDHHRRPPRSRRATRRPRRRTPPRYHTRTPRPPRPAGPSSSCASRTRTAWSACRPSPRSATPSTWGWTGRGRRTKSTRGTPHYRRRPLFCRTTPACRTRSCPNPCRRTRRPPCSPCRRGAIPCARSRSSAPLGRRVSSTRPRPVPPRRSRQRWPPVTAPPRCNARPSSQRPGRPRGQRWTRRGPPVRRLTTRPPRTRPPTCGPRCKPCSSSSSSCNWCPRWRTCRGGGGSVQCESIGGRLPVK